MPYLSSRTLAGRNTELSASVAVKQSGVCVTTAEAI